MGDQPIEIIDHDPAWTAAFEKEHVLLAEALGERVTGGIHHVGSTAVPGLAAKPTIDILVGIESLASGLACVPDLAQLDYLHAPYLPEEMVWLCKPDPRRRTHHLHLVPTGSRRYEDELAFRDALRTDSGLAAEYERLKRDLAERHRDDREAYTAAKSKFVRAALT